ncbi:MAG: succinyl-diaminopimelate desuccinylase [Solirubrobacteraceae bacterium]|jgi:succinyl-diaminopimelate desuccinylase|nr:succinyl-diaminopimelate desuccinylase [Solirubrobacteraceae bacterium]
MSPADRLASRTLELIDVPSESRNEDALAALVLDVLRPVGARNAGDTCVLAGTTTRGERPLVLLAGHLDTVPAQDNIPGHRDAEAIRGLGAADMKGAVAVMVELALSGLGDRANVDVGYVFFGREELPVIHSALTPLLEREPGLTTADAVIVMEPTANTIHAGCLGNINATWTFPGTSGHSARPWLADNAIHRAAAGIDALAHVPYEPHEFDGLRFTQVVSVTRIEGGIAGNVIPDRATAQVNFRYAPGTSADEAEALLRGWCEPYGAVTIDSNAPSAPVATGNALVQRLVATGDLAVEPKQAWTPVAEFAAAGVDAVNFGPGDPRYAHTRDEQVAVDALVRSYETLERFACG